MSIAALQSRVARVSLKMLANATADWTPSGGGSAITGVAVRLDQSSEASPFDGFSASGVNYRMTYLVTDLPGIITGEAVTIGGIQYRVRNPVHETDGSIAVALLGV